MRPAGFLLALPILVSALATACSAQVAPTPTPSAASPIDELGAPGCDPASPIAGDVVEGTGIGSTTAAGLLQAMDPDLPAGEPIKLVVRMTGSGELSVDLTAPDGSARELDWGPEPHGTSNFNRPGDEWGTGFTFDAPGCWAINLHRSGGEEATFWLVSGDAG